MQELLNQARGQLRHEPIERRVRAELDGHAVVDSTRAILVWEPRRVVPSFAVPVEDVRAELAAAPATTGQAKGVLVRARPLEAGNREAPARAARAQDDPLRPEPQSALGLDFVTAGKSRRAGSFVHRDSQSLDLRAKGGVRAHILDDLAHAREQARIIEHYLADADAVKT